MALDVDAILESLCTQTRERLVRWLECDRRFRGATKAFYEALEERFGPQVGHDTLYEKYDGAWQMATSSIDVLHKEVKGDTTVEFRIRHGNYTNGALIRETVLTARREYGCWKVEAPANSPAIPSHGDYEQDRKTIIGEREALTAGLRAGKYRTLDELGAAARELSRKAEQQAK